MRVCKIIFSSVMFVITIGFFTQNLTFAHNGGRDELGGHFRSSDCTYLLHEPTPLAKTAKDIEELEALIKKNNNNSKCSQDLTVNKIELEGYTFSGSKQIDKQQSEKNTSGQLKLGGKYPAILEKCTDGDTAIFSINGKSYKTRFLYIDTPESTNQIEPFGKEASTYTCEFLKSGNIILETDGRSLFDKYKRLLAWVWVDDRLHQEEITKLGLVEDFYDYGTYKYEDRIIDAMKEAKESKVGMFALQKQDRSDDKVEVVPDSVEDEKKVIEKSPLLEPKKENQKEKQPNFTFTTVIIIIILLVIGYLFFRKS